MSAPHELQEVLVKLPWVPIGVATAVIIFSILGLRWLRQQTLDEDEQMALLDRAFAQSADDLDPAAQPGFYGGWTDEYVWNQGKEEVEVHVWVPEDTRAKDIRVDVTSTTLDVAVKEEPIISGDLDAAVQGTETVWYLERDVQGSARPPPKHVAVVVTLQKKISTDPKTHWTCLINGDDSRRS